MKKNATPKEMASAYVKTKNADVKKKLETEAGRRIAAFLNDKLPVDEDDSPFWLTFLRVFSKTPNVDLNLSAKKAEAKLMPLLIEFDRKTGIDYTNPVTVEQITANLDRIDELEKQNPLERPEFGQIKKIFDSSQMIDDDGNIIENNTLADDILDSAKLKTGLRLCLNSANIIEETYFAELKAETESLLLSLLLAEESEKGLDPAREEEIRNEFQKFLDVIDE